MNYAGRFDATFSSDGLATHSQHAYVHVDSSQTHAPADALIVPDAQLLFHADYSRSGADLILSKDDHRFVLHDYFRGDKRVALASPDGAHLTADIVKALVGEVDVAQAGDAPAASHVIGHVTKLQGSATVIRNGVSVILNMGDNVEKGDVVQSGGNSTLGITFIDGTVFGLGANARMVLNDMVYDPHGSNNSSLLSLVAGTITFVAGETAKHGDMKVDTPVATMGIRGTAVLVEIDFDVPGQNGTPNASFQVLVEPDGTTGSYILFDKTTLQPIAIVNQAGQQININNGVVSQTTVPLSPDIQKLITDVFQQKFTDNSNTKTTSPTNDTITPQNGPIIKLANGTTAQPVNVVTNTADTTPTLPTTTQSTTISHIGGPPQLDIFDLQGLRTPAYFRAEIPGKTHDTADRDTVVFTARFNDINQGDSPTVSASFDHYAYKNALGQDVTASLSALQQTDIAATAIRLALAPADGNSNIGTVSLTYTLADSNFDFLAAGEQLTLTYDVTVNNNYAPNPETRTVQVTITIVGTNDAPVITTAAPTIDFAAGTSTPGGTLQSRNPTSGTLNFSDVDLTDTHTVSTRLAAAVMSNGGTIPPLPEKLFEHALSASIGTDSTGTGNGVIDWQLAPLPVYLADFIPKGQSVTLTYDVTVTDSQGAVSTQTVTVTITGTNSAAVVWIDTGPGGGSWNDAANWETGAVPTASDDAIIITNQLIGLTPSYPVTVEHDAAAHSLTLNDFGNSPPTLINDATLTIGAGGISASADSIIENRGTITVAGAAEFVDHSVLQNSGLLKLDGGGDFKDSAGITNLGTIEVAGGTLNVVVDIANADATHSGLIQVDAGATLALSASTANGLNGAFTVPHKIDGGTVTVIGTLDLEGSVSLMNGSLGNSGLIDILGGGNTLDNEIVTNSNQITVESGAFLTIDLGTIVSGGLLTNAGTIDVETSGATFDNADIDNSGGTIQVDSGLTTTTLLLADDTSITNGNVTVGPVGILEVSAGSDVSLTNVILDNGNLVQVDADATLTLDNTTITGGNVANGGTVNVDADKTLTLNNAIISGGIVTNDGTINSTGGGVIEDADITNIGLIESTVGIMAIDPANQTFTLTNSGTVEANGGELDITGEQITNTDALNAINGGTLKLSDLTVTNTDGTVTVNPNSTLDLASASITGGSVNIVGTLDHVSGNDTISADITNAGTFEVTGGTLTVDAQNKIINDAGGNVQASDRGTLDINGSIDNAGTIAANGGIINIAGTVCGTGSAAIANHGILHFESTVVATQTVAFEDATGTLAVSDLADFHATTVGFRTGDTIDLTSISLSPGEYDVWAQGDGAGTLSIYSGVTLEAQLKLSGIYSQGEFALASDGTGGTDIVWSKAQGATVSGLDNAGNPVDGYAVTANLNDPTAGNIAYAWLENGQVVQSGDNASFTPTSPLEAGDALAVVISFTDRGVTEQVTEFAGTVVAAPIVTFGTAGPVSTTEDTALQLNALNATFADAGNDTITATLSVSDGTLTIGNEGGIGSTNDAQSVTLTGTLEQIDAALASGVTYLPDSAFAGNDALSFSLSDHTPGNTFTASGALSITVNALEQGATADILSGGDHDGDGGAGNANWSDSDDWSLGTAPGGQDSVFFDPSVAVVTDDLAANGGNESIAQLNVPQGTELDITNSAPSNPYSFTITGAQNVDGTSVALVNDGIITVSDGVTLEIASAVSGTGTLDIGNDGTIQIDPVGGAVSVTGQTILFDNAGPNGKLIVGGNEVDATALNAAIKGFGTGDSIDLTGIGYSAGEHAVWTQGAGAQGTLAIYDAGDHLEASLNLDGTYSTDNFAVVSDGASGTPGTDIHFATPNASAPVVTLGPAALNFATLDDPGTFGTSPSGINDAGIIVGSTNADANHQVAWEYSGGTFTQIGASLGAQDVSSHDINNNDVIVGDYSPVRSTPRYGFIDSNGTFTQVASDSPYPSTNANGINDAGVVVGSDYLHSGARYTGYIYSGGSFTYINAPGTDNPSGDTYADGINNEGQVVGAYNPNANNTNAYLGYIYDSVRGTFTDIADPLGVKGTFASGINDHGQVVGWYVDANGQDHGFVESGGIYTTIDDPLGVKGSVVTGINNSDQMVGYYVDANGNLHGFETTFSTTQTAEFAPLVLNSINVADAAAGSNSIQVQLSVGHGTLALNNSAGVLVSFDANHDLMTLTGSTAAIDTALALGVIYTGASGFIGNDTLTVTANDEGHTSAGTTETLSLTVVNPTVTITALTQTGLDLNHHDLAGEMGAGTVQPGGTSSTFTIVDSADHVQFVVDGAGLTYDGTAITGGTITSFEELTTDPTPVALGNFMGFSVDAPTWMSDVQQAAAGNKAPFNALISTYAFDFIGGSGNDSIGPPPAPAGSHDTLTGGAGSDTFEYNQGDGAVTITDFDQGNSGSFNTNEGDTLVLNGFSGQPTFTYANGNTIADFGNGDVLTLLGITQQDARLITVVNNGGNNNGGKNNGPVLGNANNNVTYSGTPVTIDPAVTLSDTAATVSSVNVWISSGEQSGDQLTINGTTSGDLTVSGGTIHYQFDATLNTSSNEGHGLVLSAVGGSPTTADFQTALQLIQFSSTSNDPTAGGTDSSRTITWAAQDNNANFSQTVTTTVNLSAPSPNYSWNELQYPAATEGVHQFGVNPQYDAFGGVVVLVYGDTTHYTTTETGYSATRYVEALDPFFLPDQHAAQTINTSTVDVPARYNFILPNVSFSGNVLSEGIFVYKGQVNSDGTGGNALWQILGTPDSNGDGGVTLGTPTEIGNASTTGNTIYDLTESFRNVTNSVNVASYDVAWDQYNSATSQYSVELQITKVNSDGSFASPTIFSPVIDEDGDHSVTVANTALPAWEFRPGGGNYVLALSEVDSTTNPALNLSGAHDEIHFQGYNNDGTTNAVNFAIQPDLTHYAPGATNEIVWQTIPSLSPYPGQTVQAIQFVQVSQGNNFDYAVAWNETVIDSNGTHDQVEFAVLNGTGNGATIFHTTFQIADGDPQNLRIGEFADQTTPGQDDVVVVYGDDSGTHILEYAITNGGNTVTELASFTDPTTHAFSNLTVMGDGRITLTYDNLVNALPDETSQYLFKTFDLRTAGININDSARTDGQNQYVAGTHFSDIFTGENSVTNEYYFVGQNSANSTPVDHFTGGNGGSNVAIFAEARSDYTIVTDGSDATTVTSNGLDPEHNGSLVTSNVQLLAFDPATDPTPHNGTINVNGGTDVVLGGNDAITIEPGSTAEIDTGSNQYTGSVTFEAATGTLALDQPADFSGQIAGITGSGDVLDLLHGFNAATTTAVTGSGSYDSTSGTTMLTVTDSSNHETETFKLAGDLSGSTWTVSDDHHGGVDIVDPPSPANSSPGFVVMHDPASSTVSNIVATSQNQTLTGTGSADNFVFNSNFGKDTITNYAPGTDSITLDHTAFTGNVNALLAATQDDGNGNTVITVDAHDTITLQHVLKAQLAAHTFDFHFV